MTARIFASPGSTSHQGGRRRGGGREQKTKSVFSPSSSKENTSADGVTHRRLCTCSCCATTSSPNLSVPAWKAHLSAPKFVYIYLFFILKKNSCLSASALFCANRSSPHPEFSERAAALSEGTLFKTRSDLPLLLKPL